MFFKGAVFQCTYHQDGVFIHYQISLCYDDPQQIDLVVFERIKMLVTPLTIKYDIFIFNPDLPEDHYIQIGLKEV